MNKSVTFANQVRVREYDNRANGRNQFRPTNLANQFNSSPYGENRHSLVERNSSPLRPALREYSPSPARSPSPSRYNDMGGSPLVLKSGLRMSTSGSPARENYAAEPLRMSSGFDRVEQGEIIKIFKDSIFLERELEAAKIELSLKPDFNLLDAFRLLDNSGKGWLTS